MHKTAAQYPVELRDTGGRARFAGQYYVGGELDAVARAARYPHRRLAYQRLL